MLTIHCGRAADGGCITPKNLKQGYTLREGARPKSSNHSIRAPLP